MTRLVLSLAMTAMLLTACDAGMPNDVANRMERQRLEAPQPKPTDLPPGLAQDLP